MRKTDMKLIAGYLHRFFCGPVFSKQKWTALWRYVGIVFSWCIEKMTGVDYSMVYYTKDESIHNSVYTKVPQKVMKRIFNDIENIESKNFVDVGCGKGYAIKLAERRGFKITGGIEYTAYLFDICCRNLQKERIAIDHVYNMDAKNFDYYGDFDIFFFNNPFDETIMEPVAQKIFDSHIGRKCFLYFLNPHQKPRTDAVEKAGFKLIKQIPDKNESYFNINVYSNQKKDSF